MIMCTDQLHRLIFVKTVTVVECSLFIALPYSSLKSCFLKGVIGKLPFCFFFLQNVIAWTNLGVLYLKHGKIEVNNMKI